MLTRATLIAAYAVAAYIKARSINGPAPMPLTARRAQRRAMRNNKAPREHVVQFYEDDAVLLASVSEFIRASLQSGGMGIIVATSTHIAALERIWKSQRLDLRAFRAAGRYIALDAASALDGFLVEGWPDEQRFFSVFEPMLRTATQSHANVSVFGEMVSLLWSEGRHGAAVHLEQLWNELTRRYPFTLLCAYRMSDMAHAPPEAMHDVCGEHTRAIPTESYTTLVAPEERAAEICELQQKAMTLEREIRHRKAIEHTLAQRERELSDFLENAPYAMHSVTADGTIVWANQFELAMLGYSAAEYIGHNVAEFYDDADAEPLMDRLLSGSMLVDEPTRVRCKDGSIRDVLITSNGRWERGAFVQSRCFMRDVTDQKRSDDAMPLLAAIVESSDDAIVSKTLEGRIKTWNRGAVRLFGWLPDEVIGKPITTIIPPELRHEEDEILAKIGRGERVDHFETVRVTKDGRRVDVSLTISPVRDARGKIVGASKIARDISERKRTEEMLRLADRRKDEFLAILGHELRNMLTPVRNVSEVLRRSTRGDEKYERLCEMLERQVQQMARLLDDLLDVSRIRQGKIKFERAPIDFRMVVQRGVEVSRSAIDARQQELTVSLPDSELPVLGDLARLVQMLTNVLNNASKYTPERGRIALSVAQSGRMVELRIADNGIGIGADVLPRIFDMFVQDDAQRQAKDGLGIGLMLVRKIVEHHGGHVRAHSEGRGKGSEFVVTLPMLDAVEVRIEPSAAKPRQSDEPATPKRILIVDDNRDLSESFAALLRLSGHEVMLGGDGYSALRMIETLAPDLTLLDIGIPGIDGYEVARRLRAGGSAARLVAVTGYGGAEDRQRSLEAGFDEHIVKPIDPAVLDRLIALERAPVAMPGD